MNSFKYTLISLLILISTLAASQELEKVSIQLHWKYQFEFAGYIAAKEKGFYEELGLDVEIKEYEFGMDVEEEVVSSRSNYGVYNSTILLSHLKNRPINLMASFFKRSAMVIITKPEIKNLQQLIGKNFMAINDTNLRHMFETQKVDTQRINIVKPSYNINDFADGKVDAMTAFISNQPYKLDQLGVKYNIIDPGDFGVYILQQELFTSNREIKNNFEGVVKFKDATIRGWEYALKNQDELVDIIHSKYSKNISKDSLKNEAVEIQKLMLPFSYQLGSIDANFLAKQLELFKKESRIGENVTVKSFIFNDEYKNGKLFIAKWRDQETNSIVDYSLLLKFLAFFSVAFLTVFYFLTKQRKLQKSLQESNLNLERRVSDKTQELEKAKALFESIFETVKDGIAILDLEYKFLLVNRAYKDMVGYDKEELYGKTCIDISLASTIGNFQEVKEVLIKKGFYGGYKKQYVSKDGKIVDVRVDLILMLDKKSVLMVVKDVTRENIYKKEKKYQEQQLLEQSRLAQMGEMLSMIAHQWRQPLAAISSTSTGLELKATLDKADREIVIRSAKNISKYSQHLSETINDFRDFFKSNKDKKETSYVEIINSVSSIVQVSIENKNIEFITEFQSTETFSTFPNELKQVVLNLIKNAEDVVVEKKIEKPYIKLVTHFREGEHILEVSDNGGGVSKAIREKIFDPYFSTKEGKNGTGLGLYMSKTIIEDHCGGRLDVQNSEYGAVFSISLKDT